MKAIKTSYVGQTNTKPSRIKASAEGVPSKFYSVGDLSLETESDDAGKWHSLAAEKFRDLNSWKLPLASGQIGPDDHVHCFIERVRETVPVTAALLAELADIRDRGNSPKVAREACIEAQKGYGPTPAHLEQLRSTLPVTKAQSAYYTLPHGNGFDVLEVHTCRTYTDGIGNDFVEQVDHDEDVQPSDFFYLYGHITGTGLECIGDFTTFEAACAVAEKLGAVA